MSEAHAWIFPDKGRLARAFSVGEAEVAFDRGDRTPAEKELGEWRSHEVDEEMVMRGAAGWSLNPLTLEQKRLPRGRIGTNRPEV